MYTSTAKQSTARRVTMLGMFSAIAYLLMVVGRFPLTSVEFLKYDPKDVAIAIAGLLYGPFSALLISVVVSLVEMFTVSTTGIIGFIMNALSSIAFCCTAAAFYQKKRTLQMAGIGLIAGTLLATAIMVLWNYLITPLYMGLPREAVVEMLVPIILPFNLLKYGISAGLTLLLYKPLIRALRASGLLPPREEQESAVHSKSSLGVVLIAALIVATCILIALVMKGVI